MARSVLIIVEHQRRIDRGKRFSWPLYAAALHAQLRCPVCLLVVSADDRVAAWAAQPIETLQTGSPFRPLVLGRGAVPRIVDVGEARGHPELAALSALAHGNEAAGLEVVRAAIEAVAALGDERVTVYYDLIVGALNEATRLALEADMQARNYQYGSDFARRYFEEGREEGSLEAGRAAVVRLVAERLGQVPEPIAARIAATADVGQLLDWTVAVARASNAAAVRALFE